MTHEQKRAKVDAATHNVMVWERLRDEHDQALRYAAPHVIGVPIPNKDPVRIAIAALVDSYLTEGRANAVKEFETACALNVDGDDS